jgi:ElaB/YqjD/DUF883 family membrane-anchored ribosome-binding protein
MFWAGQVSNFYTEISMDAREPSLPEGTDQVIQGASGSSDGFVAKRGSDGAGTDRLVSQVREQVSTLRGQAGDRIRTFADDGKSRATGLLDDFSEVINEAARSVDQKFGEDYGDYAHRAADAVSSFAGKVRSKSVDDLVGDARTFARKSPGIAIGVAAVAGFALMRLIKTGVDDINGRRSGSDA